MLFSALIIYKPENGSESPVSDSKRMSHSSHLGITPGACYGSVTFSELTGQAVEKQQPRH